MMINILTVIAVMALSAVFYILEFKYSKLAFEWGNVKGSVSKEFKFLKCSSMRCLWLARLFLISGIILAIIEQYQFIGLE